MKKLLPILLVLCLLLCACGEAPAEDNTTPSTAPTAAAPTESKPAASTPTETTAPAETTAPTEATEPVEVSMVNPLNGEPLEEHFMKRPFALMVNNLWAALPQYGISQADILFEILDEGDVSRFVAVFSDPSEIEKLGSVRSTRTYYIDVARSLDAILCHAGTSESGDRLLSQLGYDTVNANTSLGGAYYYRDQDRLNGGYDYEHTLFTSGAELVKGAKNQGIATEYETPRTYGLNFVEDATPEGEAADHIKVTFISYSKETEFNYDADSHRYIAYEYSNDLMDANVDEAAGFENVLVCYASHYFEPDGFHRVVELVSSGDGYFACGGQIIPIHWERNDHDQFFTFTNADGSPLEINVGHTYIAFIPTGYGIVSYE